MVTAETRSPRERVGRVREVRKIMRNRPTCFLVAAHRLGRGHGAPHLAVPWPNSQLYLKFRVECGT
jgi:hypothetical protein